jgi:hypothetical protein
LGGTAVECWIEVSATTSTPQRFASRANSTTRALRPELERDRVTGAEGADLAAGQHGAGDGRAHVLDDGIVAVQRVVGHAGHVLPPDGSRVHRHHHRQQVLSHRAMT